MEIEYRCRIDELSWMLILSPMNNDNDDDHRNQSVQHLINNIASSIPLSDYQFPAIGLSNPRDTHRHIHIQIATHPQVL